MGTAHRMSRKGGKVNAYQKEKVKRSLDLLRTMLGFHNELREFCRKNHKQPMTVCVGELVRRCADDDLVFVVRRTHTNGQEDYEAIGFEVAIKRLQEDLKEELRVLGKED